MTHLHTEVEGPELISAPSVRLATGEIVTYWQGPPRVREIHPGRQCEYRRALALLTVGLARIRTKPQQYVFLIHFLRQKKQERDSGLRLHTGL